MLDTRTMSVAHAYNAEANTEDSKANIQHPEARIDKSNSEVNQLAGAPARDNGLTALALTLHVHPDLKAHISCYKPDAPIPYYHEDGKVMYPECGHIVSEAFAFETFHKIKHTPNAICDSHGRVRSPPLSLLNLDSNNDRSVKQVVLGRARKELVEAIMWSYWRAATIKLVIKSVELWNERMKEEWEESSDEEDEDSSEESRLEEDDDDYRSEEDDEDYGSEERRLEGEDEEYAAEDESMEESGEDSNDNVCDSTISDTSDSTGKEAHTTENERPTSRGSERPIQCRRSDLSLGACLIETGDYRLKDFWQYFANSKGPPGSLRMPTNRFGPSPLHQVERVDDQ